MGDIIEINGAQFTQSNLADYEIKEFYEEDIGSIDRKPVFTNYQIYVDETAQPAVKMSQFFNQMPYGLIDKQITGLGATHLEIHSHRDSIIVLPTVALAWNKYVSASKEMDLSEKYQFFYAGSRPDDDRPVRKAFIEDWSRHTKEKYAKILVVADSLPAILDVIGVQPDNPIFFLMIDEADSYQIDAIFRESLSKVIDIYFKWNNTMRAMVSATFQKKSIRFPRPLDEFPLVFDETEPSIPSDSLEIAIPGSSLRLIEKEPLIQIRYRSPKQSSFKLIYTNDPTAGLIDTILRLFEKESQPTILVAYNDINEITHTINALKAAGATPIIKVLFSEHNTDEVLNHYRYRLQDSDNKLGNDQQEKNGPLVAFITSAFFVGIDIMDKNVHMIMVSSSTKDHRLLSVERIDQIRGRLRNGAKDVYIIYDSQALVKCRNCTLFHFCYDNGLTEDPAGPYYWVHDEERHLPNYVYSIYLDDEFRCWKIGHLPNPFLQEGNKIRLLEKAATLIEIENDIKNSLTKYCKTFTNESVILDVNKIFGTLKTSLEKSSYSSVDLIRYDRDGKPTINYLGIDATTNQQYTKYCIYKTSETFHKALLDHFGELTEIEESSRFFDTNTDEIDIVQTKKRDNVIIERMFDELIQNNGNGSLQKYLKGKLPKNKRFDSNEKKIAYIFNIFQDYLSFDDILLLLRSYFDDKTSYRNDNLLSFYRSLSFLLMDYDHPFKRDVLSSLQYPKDSPFLLSRKERISITKEVEDIFIKRLLYYSNRGALHKVSIDQSSVVKAVKEKNEKTKKEIRKLIDCFFEMTKSHNRQSIIGLYPRKFKDSNHNLLVHPLKTITYDIDEEEDFFTKYYFPNFISSHRI